MNPPAVVNHINGDGGAARSAFGRVSGSRSLDTEFFCGISQFLDETGKTTLVLMGWMGG